MLVRRICARHIPTLLLLSNSNKRNKTMKFTFHFCCSCPLFIVAGILVFSPHAILFNVGVALVCCWCCCSDPHFPLFDSIVATANDDAFRLTRSLTFTSKSEETNYSFQCFQFMHVNLCHFCVLVNCKFCLSVQRVDISIK